ncbi:MAG: hypothetical protein AAF579_06965 [Cyanobacteria bacterium P01_C01_bin.118]
MAVLSLKTELDVAELLLTEGWFPEEINSILVFPLPNAIFRHLARKNGLSINVDVIKVTSATPTTIYRARQLLMSAGCLDRELDSLLKPYLYGDDAWVNQTIHAPSQDINNAQHSLLKPLLWVNPAAQSLKRYQRNMALKRIGSLAMVIALVVIVVILLG